MKTLKERINTEWIFFDGALGTMLQKKGLTAGQCPEMWNLSHPDALVEIHKAYLEAGAHIINANTFGANRFKVENVEEVVTAGIALAKKAVQETGRQDAYVALDIGPTGKLLAPMGDLDFEEAVSTFAEMVKAGAKAGADLVLIETMSDSYEAKAALLAAKENCDLPVFITFIFDENHRLLSGGSVQSVIPMCEGLHADAVGINCGLGPEQMIPIVQEIVHISSLPVIVNPNAGLPRQVEDQTIYDLSDEEFACWMKKIASFGVQGVGGCCGTTPSTIKALVQAIQSCPFHPIIPKNQTWVTSYSQAVQLGPQPIVIGERINPTGKKRLKEALRHQEYEYVLSQALEQEAAGAQILDVNVGLPEIDEAFMMKEMIYQIQSVSACPLQIDTGNLEALERGLRIYNGRPMVNSVNGKLESMETVFPLIKKYGAVVVGLCLDEHGIPETAKERVDIARKIYAKAKEYGIPSKDIVIDGLAMTISSSSHAGVVALETIETISREFHGHTILGVSNISFGLPQRDIINSHFLTMALTKGLSCAIINPNSEAMMKSYRSYLALQALDPQCQGYIGAYGSALIPKVSDVSEDMTLTQAIQAGLKGKAELLTKELLNQKEPLETIDAELIPALDQVGKEYEAGTLFLPQLLMSAEAAKVSFAVIKDKMPQDKKIAKGRIVLATVQGDIHDIGKNIVKVLLENYGYEVIDLGKDVAPEQIVSCVKKEKISLVGLSALMTTTVVNMEKTIQLLHEQAPEVKIMVGGAVLNSEYAKMIHADHYAADAMGSVRYADQIFLKGQGE